MFKIKIGIKVVIYNAILTLYCIVTLTYFRAFQYQQPTMVALGRVDPEVAKEHGLIPASRMEMLSELRSLFVNWEPWY